MLTITYGNFFYNKFPKLQLNLHIFRIIKLKFLLYLSQPEIKVHLRQLPEANERGAL